ncbi:MAG TPA: MATE family efflux transporter [Bacillota bacterium]
MSQHPPARPGGFMQDFTTGSIWRHILVFSWPMFVGNLFQALYNTVDSFWVGRYLGAGALGAVSIAFPIIFALVSLIMGLTMATTTLVAQYRGARQEDQVRRTVANSVLLIVFFGGVATATGYGLRFSILEWIRTPAELLEPAAVYLGIFSLGLIPMFLFNALSAVLRGLGDSRTPLRFLIYATLLNIVLDPLFILGWDPIHPMGIAGAAWATVIAQVVSAFLVVRHIGRVTDLFPRNREQWRPEGTLVRMLLAIGLPAGVQTSLVAFSETILTAVVNTFGTDVVAGFGVGIRIDQLAFLPALSIGLAVTALVGQNLGAGKQERVREIVRSSSILTVGITGAVTAVVLGWAEPLILVFTGEPAVIFEGARYLRIVGLSFVPLGLIFVIGGVLRGAGDTFATMVITFLTMWVARLPLAWYLSYGIGWGAAGTWWAVVFSTVIGLALNWAYYRTGNWLKKVVVRPSPSPEPA